MRKTFTLIIALLFCSVLVFGQPLTGTKTIKTTGGTYSSITAAITDLNTNGVGTGGVTFNIDAGFTEILGVPLVITATGTSANQIIFQKSGTGANPKITADTGIGTMDGIIVLSGTDYITFNGINLEENSLNTTTITQMEWGFAVLKAGPSDGSKWVTIKNCKVTLNKTNTSSVGIYFANHLTTNNTAITVADTNGTNSFGNIFNDTLTNVYTGIWIGASSTTTYYDNYFKIGVDGGNVITNFGGGSTAPIGIYTLYQNYVRIGNNTVNGGAGTTNVVYGIYASTATSGNGEIYNNTVTIQGGGTTQTIYGILCAMGGTAANNTISIYNNRVQNCTYTTATTGYFYGIQTTTAVTATFVNVYNNIVTNNTIPGTGYLYGIDVNYAVNAKVYNNQVTNNTKTGTSGYMYCTRVYYTSGTVNFYNNIIDNNSNSGTSATTAYMYGAYIYSAQSTLTTENIYGNRLSNLTCSYYIYGMYCYSYSGNTGTKNIYNDTITGLTTSGTYTSGYIYPLYIYYGATVKVYNNVISNITQNKATGTIYGIYVPSIGSCYFYNNYINNFLAPTATANPAIYGVYLSTATYYGFYYNTIYLNATSTGSAFGTTALYVLTTPTFDSRNNIIINTSTPGATGRVVAYQRSSATATTFSTLSNRNCYYVGSTGTIAGLGYFYDGTNLDTSLTAYKARMVDKDQTCFQELPPFINMTTPPYNLHLLTTIFTKCESSAIPVTSPISITTDFDGNTRNNTTPDVGADEGNFKMTDIFPPFIDYTPLPNTSSTTGRTLTATIVDASGISTTGSGLPVLKWKKNYVGSYTSATATSLGGNQYSFSFGTGAAVADSIYYYVIANDNATTPNIGVNPSAGASGFSANPPSCTTHPTFPNSYKILANMAGGNYNIGGTGTTPASGCTYVDLTAAFTDIASKEVTGAVNLVLTSYYSSSEEDAFPIVINPVVGSSSVNKVTIKPASGINAIITGISASSIIKLNGADYIIIDGSNNGTTTRNLSIINTSTAASTASIWLSSVSSTNGATYNTIKNCILAAGINSTATTYGITITGATIAAAGTNNDNNTIQNNDIYKAYVGILAIGTLGDMDTLNIIGNFIGDTATTTNYIWFKGIEVSNTTNSNISQNTIYNIITTVTTPIGLNILANVTNTNITRNNINNIVYNSTGGYGGRGMNINTANATSNLTIVNNVISVIGGDGWSSFTGTSPVGVLIDGLTGGLNIYYNSVYMTGPLTYNGVSVTTAILFNSSGISAINLRNNVFANAMNNTVSSTAKNYSIYSLAPANSFTSINNNDYYVGGTQGVLAFLGADITTLAAWKTATGADANSISSDPLFNSTTNLQANTGSPLKNAGTYISTVTTDFIGITRSATTPTIGAYENLNDISPPTITYTALANTSSTTSRTLTATITDASGVPTSGAGLPRAYWKKNYNGTYTGVTSTSLGSDQYSFVFGSGVTVNDTIFYYVAAQDIFTTPNIGVFPSAGASGFSINPPAASTPPTSPSFYRINAGLAGGTYNIGGTGTTPASGCTYVDLTAAFNDINIKEIQGAVNLVLTSYYSATEEDGFPIVINPVAGSSSVNKVTIKPASGINATITGSSASSIIKLNGADFITIDGSNNGTTSRNLTISNTSTSATTAAIWLASVSSTNGATYNTIKNCIVSAGSNSTATNYGINIGGTTIAAAGTNNDNNTIQNNDISKAYVGILATGTSGDMDTLNIIGNSVGATTGNTASYIGFKGIEVSNTTNSNISQNTIYNIYTTATTPVGLSILSNVVNTSITRNNINNIVFTSTGGYGGRGMYISTGVVSSNLTIANNIISVIGGDGYSSFYNSSPVGLYFDGTMGGLNIYYNSIYMSGSLTYSSATYTTAILFYTSTITAINLRNNVFVNTMNNTITGTSKNYAIYSSTAPAGFTSINYNDYYVSGTQGVLGYIAAADVTTLAAWKTATGADANSINVDPLFNSTTNLQPGTGSPLQNAGTYISTVTTDITGATRSATTPTIGAYENLLDVAAPTITYTPLGNTSLTTSRTLTATITDASGVPTSGAGLPRIYWKKNYNGTYSGVTSTSLGSNQYSFTFGTGVVAYDTVFYYVAAQDNYSTPNIGTSPSAGASGFTTNPPAVSTHPTSPNFYKITGSLAAGSYNIGGTGTTPASGCTYVDLTAAFADINNKVIQGAISLVLTSYYKSSEENAFPIVIDPVAGSSATNTITIKPASGTNDTITGSGAAIFKFNGADNIIIDGSNNNSTTRNLLLQNNSASGTTAVIWFSSLGTNAGCVNNIIKNCYLRNVDKTITTMCAISIGSTIGAAGNDNDYITIQNNVIQRAYCGIYANSSAAGLTNNLTIKNNILGDSASSAMSLGQVGIYLLNIRNSNVQGNTIRNMVGTINNPVAIFLSTGVDSTNVTANTITGIKYTGTGGYGGKGIDVNTGYSSSNIMIANNSLSDILGDGWSSFTSDAIVGIRIMGSTGGIKIYNNSVHLTGSISRSSSSDASAALYVGSTSPTMDVRDNIFSNSIINTLGTATAYAIYSAMPNSAYTFIDYNNYFVSGTQGVLGYLGANITTLAAWKTATLQDANSLNVNPLFVSATDLRFGAGALNKTGQPLSAVTTDIAGITRSTTNPDFGAYELALKPLAVTGTKNSITATTATINGTINANNEGTTNISFGYWLTTAYDSSKVGTPSTATGLTNASPTAALTGLIPNTLYHYRIVGTNSVGTTYGVDSTFTTLAILSVVTTDSANTITGTSATLFGNVNAKNASTASVFEYGKTITYGTSVSAAQSPVTGNTPTLVSAAISGLDPNTLYHYRVKGTNAAGQSVGNDLTFTTKSIAPTATTLVASVITSTSAQMNGQVNANNTTTTVSFQWGTTTTYGNTVTALQSPANGITSTAMSYILAGLVPNTTYHYRIVATNSAGTVYGLDTSFKTPAVLPMVKTFAATGISADSADLQGSVNAMNAKSGVSFEYGLTTSYGSTITAVPDSVSGTSYSAVTARLYGLLPNTTYHYRVNATNIVGTTNGNDTFFTTPVILPIATTDTVNAITASGATIYGTINANNDTTAVTFEYGLTTTYGNSVAAVPSQVTGLSNIPVSYNLTGLDPNTTYHFRVVATNKAGTVNGNDNTFTTNIIPPIAITESATSVASNAATLNGKVNANNDTTNAYFEYGTTITYGNVVTASPNPVAGLSLTAVSNVLSGLIPNTLYHYRVYAINNNTDTTYGADSTFTTLAKLATVNAGQATLIGTNGATLNGDVNANNSSTTVSFEFGLTTAYGKTFTASPATVNGTTSTAVSYVVTGLKHSTTYHYRIIATNAAGTSNSTDTFFTTSDTLALVTTVAATTITKSSAVSGGSITNDGGLPILSKGVCWSTTTNPVVTMSKTNDGTGSTSFVSNITGLNPSTLYYVRAYAENALGFSYGNEISFTTSPNSIKDDELAGKINIYSANKIAYINIDTKVNINNAYIQIFDMNGKKLTNTRISDYRNQVDLSAYAEAYYIVSVIVNNKVHTKKIFVE